MSQINEIQKGLSVIVKPGSVVEVRIPNAGRYGTVSGYYNEFEKLARDVAMWSGKAEGIYITINPVLDCLLARSENRLKTCAQHTTKDEHIKHLANLLIDCDVVRPAGISSTDEQHGCAINRAREVREYLRSLGWPELSLADSGNGGHLIIPTDLPNTQKATDLLKRVLIAVSLKFNDNKVIVDPSTFNPARICKLYGTLARKGNDISGYPHRYARLLEAPERVEAVSLELLEALAEMIPETPKSSQKNQSRYDTAFDIDQWITHHGLEVISTGPWNGGHKWILRECVWNGHTDRAAFILQFPKGTVAAGCLHQSCRDKKWPDLRDVIEPYWRDRNNTAKAVHPSDSNPYYDKSQQDQENEDDTMNGFYSSLSELIGAKIEMSEEVLRGVRRRQVGSLIAVTNVGKTTLINNTCLCLAAGHRCDPLLPEARGPMRVLFLDYESTTDEMCEDLKKMIENIPPDKRPIALENYIPVVEATFHGVPLCLSEPDHLNYLMAWAEGLKVDLIVIDPISKAFELFDENNNAEVTRKVMRPLYRMARRLNCALIFTHHHGKPNESPTGELAYHGRGASAFGGLSRAVYTLTREKTKGPEYVTLKCAKIKGQSFAPVLLKLEQRWFLIVAEEPASEDKLLAAQDIAELIFERFTSTGSNVKTEEICKHFADLVGRSTVMDRINDAIGLKLIERVRKGYFKPGPSYQSPAQQNQPATVEGVL